MKQAKAKKKNKATGLVLTIVINLVIVGYIAIREFGSRLQDAQHIAVGDIRLGYLAVAAACFALALLMEYVKYRRMIMTAAGRDDRRGAFECAVLGKYYDNLTPLGAGGQPFQIVYLKRRGLSTGASASVPIAGFLGLQFAFILIAAVVFITNHGVIESQGVVRVSAYIGLLFYMAVPLAIVLFAIIPKPFRAVVGAVTRFLGKLRILKNADDTAERFYASLDEYIASLRIMNRRRYFFIKILFFSLIYQLAIMSVPYFVLRAFGGENDWWTVFSLVVYIYAAITIIPTPGNSGAAEGSFYAVFSSLEGGMLFWAMILWRVLVYYSWLVTGLIVVTRGAVSGGPRPKKAVPAEGPLRIAQFCDIFYPSIDGVVRTVDAYARRIEARGSYCCVVCPRESRRDDDSRYSYDVVRTPSFRLPGFMFTVPLPLTTRRLRRMFREEGFHVLHVHSPFLVGEIALRLGRKYNIPVAATFHSKYYDDALTITHSRFLANIVTNRVVDFYNRADEVWACSQSTAETLRGYGYQGELRIMENGVELDPEQDPCARRADAAARYGVPDDKHVLLFVGQLIWQKNLRLILDTAKALSERGEDYVTLIVGSGYRGEGAEIKQYAEQLALGDAVIFTGEITDRSLLYGMYGLADLFFFPSIYDNAPLVLREAALSGVPALLAEGSNAAEVVKDGLNGYTAAPTVEAMAAKIETIFADGDPKAAGLAAKQTIPVSWDEIVDRVMRTYRSFGEQSGAREL